MPTDVKEVACIVCGLKSHRDDWQEAKYPACDNHSQKEVKEAIAKAAGPTLVK